MANREEGSLKTAGYLIGIFIMLVSGLLILGKLYRYSLHQSDRCLMKRMMGTREMPIYQPQSQQ
ncbi:MAG: hypothetical protein NC928_04715 [Candidatus Omnitrophica bacterium]|nr:hypothetical protein [Candidatus Omnitrophota bacterium]